LTDPPEAERARPLVEHELRAYPAGFRRAPLEFRKGRYDFHQLQRWKSRLSRGRLPMTGFVGIGIAENRIVIGLFDPAARPRILEVLELRGVPPAAVVFERTDRPAEQPPPEPLDWPVR
jgi:hypothetical protein